MKITTISAASEDARILVRELDMELAARYPGSPINGIDVPDFERARGYFVVMKKDDALLGCGAFRPLSDCCAEIKRMFVRDTARRRGVARQILHHLEEEIRQRGFRTIVLETGNRQPEAIALYESEGYFPIPAFLGYVGNPVSCCYAKMAQPADDPESVVQRQLDAFNARDVEALVAAYAPDAQLFEHPAKLLASGSAELRERFAARFREPNLHATLLRRIVSGAIVVDHERVTRTFPEGPGEIELVMIYEVRNGAIARSWTIMGPKTIAAAPAGTRPIAAA
jgi:GNAT superfamily N-acetyltransferase